MSVELSKVVTYYPVGNPLLIEEGEVRQFELQYAMPPNRGLPNALFEVDVGMLRQLGINVPAPSQVGRNFNLPGGGLEVPIDRAIPPEALRRVR